VEAVAADAALLAPVAPERVLRRLVGDRAVERGVEDRDVRDVREFPPRLAQRVERRSVVERRELARRLDRLLDASVDDDGIAQPRPAVDDAVCDRLRRRESVDCARLIPLDEVQLQARRARVDD
jgi:hypothetical protein